MPDREVPEPIVSPDGGDQAREVRATIIASVGADHEEAAAEAWLARWRDRLTYCSDDMGCGCCVRHWDVAGPAEAIEAIPEGLAAMSDWTHPDPEAGSSVGPPAPAERRQALPPAPRRRLRRKWKRKPPPVD
jgi:hypothetical protein